MGSKDAKPRLSEDGRKEMQQLSVLIHRRATELTDMIIHGPLNMKQLPDFVERKLLETLIIMAFTAIITILLPPQFHDGDHHTPRRL